MVVASYLLYFVMVTNTVNGSFKYKHIEWRIKSSKGGGGGVEGRGGGRGVESATLPKLPDVGRLWNPNSSTEDKTSGTKPWKSENIHKFLSKNLFPRLTLVYHGVLNSGLCCIRPLPRARKRFKTQLLSGPVHFTFLTVVPIKILVAQ